MLWDGAGIAKDERQAAEWFRRAADQGDADAQRELGWMYANETGGLSKDQTQAVTWLRKAADQGNSAAQFSVGWSFAYGVGSVKDQAVAAEWFQKSADQDNTAAQRELGVLVFNGTGVKKDQQLGLKWLRKAADKGDMTAQANLGWIYRRGLGPPKDDKESNGWYRKAAEQGDVTSQRELGHAYNFGYAMDVDEREAARWYRMAADQGDSAASNNLGNLHELGAGGQRQDYVEAVRLYEAAARQGELYGQRNLARMYREGLGVRSDAVVAYAWANLAASADSPHPKVADERDAMKQYMPNNLIAEGQRLAREWKRGTALGKSNLKPVEVAPLVVAWASKLGQPSMPSSSSSRPARTPRGQMLSVVWSPATRAAPMATATEPTAMAARFASRHVRSGTRSTTSSNGIQGAADEDNARFRRHRRGAAADARFRPTAAA